MWSWRIAGAGLALAVSIAQANGASDMCAALATRLAALEQASPGYNRNPQLDDAILRQRQELDRATVRARRNGCVAGFLFKRKSAANCGSILSIMDRMRANLTRLTAQQRRGGT